MREKMGRRRFLKQGAGAAALAAAGMAGLPAGAAERGYGISLAGWSLHRTIGVGGQGETPMLEMPRLAREEFGIEAIELVNTMLASEEQDYLKELKQRAADHDVKILLIMVDGQGQIGSPDQAERNNAIENHKRWMDHAKFFGCHSIRMNWAGAPADVVKDEAALQEFISRSAPAFHQLCEHGDDQNINVIIENHGGASSYPDAVDKLANAIDQVRFGTLPDFGNFPEEVDKYEGIDKLMKHAKAVSAKCYDFDDDTGMAVRIDFSRMIEIVCDKHLYDGYIGIEYEGSRLSEFEGIKAAKALLDKLKTA